MLICGLCLVGVFGILGAIWRLATTARIYKCDCDHHRSDDYGEQ
jgi:hypothetical protein